MVLRMMLMEVLVLYMVLDEVDEDADDAPAPIPNHLFIAAFSLPLFILAVSNV